MGGTKGLVLAVVEVLVNGFGEGVGVFVSGALGTRLAGGMVDVVVVFGLAVVVFVVGLLGDRDDLLVGGFLIARVDFGLVVAVLDTAVAATAAVAVTAAIAAAISTAGVVSVGFDSSCSLIKAISSVSFSTASTICWGSGLLLESSTCATLKK